MYQTLSEGETPGFRCGSPKKWRVRKGEGKTTSSVVICYIRQVAALPLGEWGGKMRKGILRGNPKGGEKVIISLEKERT